MDTKSAQLGALFFSPARARILHLLLGQPGERFFVRQISRETCVTIGPVQRELEALLKAGVVMRTQSGHQVYYQADPSHPVFAELQTLVAKTVVAVRKAENVHQLLRSALTPLGDRISLAFLYKSSSNPLNPAEDPATGLPPLNLMIVGDIGLDEVRPQFEAIETQSGRSIHPTAISIGGFRSALENNSSFFKSILNGEQVVLLGKVKDWLLAA